MSKSKFFPLCKLMAAGLVWMCSISTSLAQANATQTEIPLNDLSSFRDPGKSWSIAGEVTAELDEPNELNVSKGDGVLVNLPDKKNPGKDLFTNAEYGNLDLELDYTMAKGSNSGIYLLGRYEIQLMDSWGITNATSGHNGGVYERWDESRPEGQKGYQGYAPRQNVSRAPGLWQHLKISFQAPRFDDSGSKVENAKLLQVELNGVTIHENVELFGPTRGAIGNDEKATGPLRFQGDHGAVAFRNILVTRYDKPRPELTNLEYTIYEGRYEVEPGYDSLPPEAEGSSVILTSNLSSKSKQYLIRYTGTLEVKEAGEYTFNLNVPGGSGLIRINKQEVIPLSGGNGKGKVELPAGEMPFELLYSKYMDWVEPGLGLAVIGSGIREYIISDDNLGPTNRVDPILVDAREKPVLRSFMDLPDGPRVTHAVSVGSEEQVHYTYDLDHGTLVQIWRGGFLDATPMWHSRGDGSSRPIGSIQHFGNPELMVAKLPSDQAAWVSDTTGSSFRPKGYVLDENERPAFRYEVYGATVQDDIEVLENGHGIRRELSIQNPSDNLFVRLAEASTIEEMSKGMYIVGDNDYYLRLDDAGGAKPVLRNVSGRQELIIPASEKLTYSILF